MAGARAQFKGTGTINGSGNYGFLLSSIDGQVSGGGGVDKFRIKIWDTNSVVVYDNRMAQPMMPTQPPPSVAVRSSYTMVEKSRVVAARTGQGGEPAEAKPEETRASPFFLRFVPTRLTTLDRALVQWGIH